VAANHEAVMVLGSFIHIIESDSWEVPSVTSEKVDEIQVNFTLGIHLKL
jgi:hypothetical protein